METIDRPFSLCLVLPLFTVPVGKRGHRQNSRDPPETGCACDLFYDRGVGTRIGIHEKTEIWREMYDLQRTSHRVKTGFSGRKIEIRIYI